MKHVRFLTNKQDGTIGLYDLDFNLILMLPAGFKVSFFHDINIKKVKPLLKGTDYKKLIMQYNYATLSSKYFLK